MTAVSLRPEIKALCDKLEIDPGYVKHIELTPTTAQFTVYRGADGFCEGPKYIVCVNDRRARRNESGDFRCSCPSGGEHHDRRTWHLAEDKLTYTIVS